MITVYVWNFRGKDVAWGHASLRVDGGSPAGHTYISWWPSQNGRVPVLPGAPGPLRNVYRAPAISGRTFAHDVRDEQQAPDVQISVTGLDETAIKKWWAGFKNGSHPWATLGQNCSTTVAHALKAGGGDKLAAGVSGWWHSWNVVWTPDDVLRFAQAIQSRSAGARR